MAKGSLRLWSRIYHFGCSVFCVCPSAIQSIQSHTQYHSQSHLRCRPDPKREVGPLWPYFLTSFMGCHVSNGNENLCVCNWRRGAGSRSRSNLPSHPSSQSPRSSNSNPLPWSPWSNRLSHHFARPQTSKHDSSANVMLVLLLGLLLAFT